ncbi:uncharacterized protein F5891DRAFT_1012365 [Suillus fuscotomentosus]|uniref:WHIM1 domain-containing protein n=1 Tax=Suillus fuscotomentosus TaxID=1912939 RepID=A0AAD4HNX2_9AGAM|nr:uncharacterized protein F5891DRAFT_1012365 [Suillus fuscotomentosus]KAG1904680.1 hypothetical protein F5891DRAFT_1012365 [Suillus fuscotomentosus]
MSAAPQTEKKGHICPPSNAKHPSDRWESLFVYSFICKFTNLRLKLEGLETPMDFENALLTHGPDPILQKILQQFILNLRPQTRNLSIDQISATLNAVLADAFKASERTVFWDDELGANVNPFADLEGGFFAADWDLKLQVLRQLVELQLTHSIDIKGTVDRAWGVMQNKHKKKDPETAPPESNDSRSQLNLQLVPLGQDAQRKRYWVADDSPRIYVSTNPWKITATFQAVSSTRAEYISVIEKLKASSPQGDRKNKLEQAHTALVKALESRIDLVDADLARVQKARKKIEQRQILMAQAEIRQTRTRRQTRRPDYVYHDADSGEDDADEYQFEEDNDYDDEPFAEDNFGSSRSHGRRQPAATAQRRSTRATKTKRPSPDLSAFEWKGERRSARLGPSEETPVERPSKRARTEESTMSSTSAGWPPVLPAEISNGVSKAKANGAAAVKPTEIAVEQLGGKKKSKFWFYAVEPISAPSDIPPPGGSGSTSLNGYEYNGDTGRSGTSSNTSLPTHGKGDAMDIDSQREFGLSPVPLEGLRSA